MTSLSTYKPCNHIHRFEGVLMSKTTCTVKNIMAAFCFREEERNPFEGKFHTEAILHDRILARKCILAVGNRFLVHVT